MQQLCALRAVQRRWNSDAPPNHRRRRSHHAIGRLNPSVKFRLAASWARRGIRIPAGVNAWLSGSDLAGPRRPRAPGENPCPAFDAPCKASSTSRARANYAVERGPWAAPVAGIDTVYAVVHRWHPLHSCIFRLPLREYCQDCIGSLPARKDAHFGARRGDSRPGLATIPVWLAS
jgi:hypothetical protein